MVQFFEEEARYAISGRNILELASGTGVLGLHMAQMGSQRVIMTDKEKMIGLLERNIAENESHFTSGSAQPVLLHAASLDWLESRADPVVTSAAPFHTIVMSDVIYEEEIVEPLVSTLRRLCHLNLQAGSLGTQIYMCASHRAERLESLFFATADPWFAATELTQTVNEGLRRRLNKDAIAIWVLEVRQERLRHLVNDIGELRSSPLSPKCGLGDEDGEGLLHQGGQEGRGALDASANAPDRNGTEGTTERSNRAQGRVVGGSNAASSVLPSRHHQCVHAVDMDLEMLD
jgi:hypothetical protein